MSESLNSYVARGALIASEFISDADAHSDIQKAITSINYEIGKLIHKRSMLERAAQAIAEQASE